MLAIVGINPGGQAIFLVVSKEKKDELANEGWRIEYQEKIPDEDFSEKKGLSEKFREEFSEKAKTKVRGPIQLL